MRVEHTRFTILILIIGVCLALVLCTYYVFVIYKGTPKSDREHAFTGTALTLENGASLDVTQFGSTPVIVISWATWCPSCIDALTMFAKVKETYGDRIVVVAVNRKEEQEIIENYKQAIGLPSNITLVNDPSDAYFKNVDGRSMPEVLVYNKKGALVKHMLATPSEDELRTIVQEILPE